MVRAGPNLLRTHFLFSHHVSLPLDTYLLDLTSSYPKWGKLRTWKPTSREKRETGYNNYSWLLKQKVIWMRRDETN